MNGPTKNRLSGYEAGWLRLLVKMGIATEQDAWDATCRAAQRLIAAINEQRTGRQWLGQR